MDPCIVRGRVVRPHSGPHPLLVLLLVPGPVLGVVIAVRAIIFAGAAGAGAAQTLPDSF